MADSPSGTLIDYARIEAMVGRLVAPFVKPAPDPDADPVALRAEYLVAVDVIKLLSDMRFRCLVFVTAMAAVASAVLPTTADPGMRPALGVLGLLATLGITIYELRNSQLYEAAIHRAKTLEVRLGMEGSSPALGRAGLFGERPPYVRAVLKPGEKRELRFWRVVVKHDHGLALIYGAALGAWVYLAVYGVLTLPVPADLWLAVSVGYLRLFAAVLATAAGVSTIIQFVIHDKRRLKAPRPVRLAATATNVSFAANRLIVDLSDGRKVEVPLDWYPDLAAGTDLERQNCRIIKRGERIRWPDLDVQISVNDLIAGRHE